MNEHICAFINGRPCPWGPIQSIRNVGPGIDYITTGGHGGFRLTQEAYDRMPIGFRLASFTRDQYFEEDLSWSAVVLAFHREMTWSAPDQREVNLKVARETWARHYASVYGSEDDVWKVHRRKPEDGILTLSWSTCSLCNEEPIHDESGRCSFCLQGM